MPTPHLPSLNLIRVFEVAARRLSFKDAANELFVSPPAVSHQIKALEESLGVALFKRENRKISLTSEGKRYYLHVKRGLDLIDSATLAVRKERKLEEQRREARRRSLVVGHSCTVPPISTVVSAGRHVNQE